jgi:hypothetical protein
VCGLMNVRVEVWPVAADELGVWLLSGDGALYSAPIPQDSTSHFEVEHALADAGFPMPDGQLRDIALMHSTSWREDGPHALHTYVTVADAGSAYVLDRWPHAVPITDALLATVGRPPTHGATDRPAPRNVDVLAHAVRHLAFLRRFDATAAAALPAAWTPHLDALTPALAGLYSEVHAATG